MTTSVRVMALIRPIEVSYPVSGEFPPAPLRQPLAQATGAFGVFGAGALHSNHPGDGSPG